MDDGRELDYRLVQISVETDAVVTIIIIGGRGCRAEGSGGDSSVASEGQVPRRKALMQSAASRQYASLGLDELRAQAVLTLTVVLLLAAVWVFWLVADDPTRWTMEPVPVVGVLLLTALATYLLLPRNLMAAIVVLVTGLLATITTALYAFNDHFFAAAYPVVAIIAGVLLGWRFAGAVGVASGAVVLAITRLSPGVLPAGVAEAAVLLTLANLLLSWLLSRPISLALEWSWTSYLQALEKTEEARARQAELAKLSRSLEEACQRLEAANEELDRARKSAEEAHRHKTEFATTISHELRTPLNLIVGLSEMMVLGRSRTYGQPLPRAFRGDIEAIFRNASHVSHLIDDILDLAQVDAHRMPLHRQPTRLAQVADEAARAVSTPFRDKGLDLLVEIPADLPPLMVDPSRIRQVLINLLGNAASFTNEGGVCVSARQDGNEVLVSVADTGIGIPEHELGNVFQEFHQLGEQGPRKGSGLGLAISKRFVEMHGGSMWVESQVGVGTTFRFSLPLGGTIVASAAPTNLARLRVPPQPASREPAVALLARDPDAARVFQRYLDGYRVVAVEPGQPATPPAEAERPVAIAVPLTRGESPDTVEIPAAFRGLPRILCQIRTARSILREHGATDYLVKPVGEEHFAALLRSSGRPWRRVLVVDDDPETVQLFARMIRAVAPHASVDTVISGLDALQRLRDRRPDVVFLDMLMPDLDGLAVLKCIRDDPALSDLPVIIVSGRGYEREAITFSLVGLSRDGGLSVGEAMRYVRSTLNAMAAADASDSDRGLPGDPDRAPVSGGTPRSQAS